MFLFLTYFTRYNRLQFQWNLLDRHLYGILLSIPLIDKGQENFSLSYFVNCSNTSFKYSVHFIKSTNSSNINLVILYPWYVFVGFMVKICFSEEKRIKRNEDSLRNIWDNVKRPNIQIIGVPEEEDKKRAWENTWGDNSLKLP